MMFSILIEENEKLPNCIAEEVRQSAEKAQEEELEDPHLTFESWKYENENAD